MKAGDISEPMRTPSGFHLFRSNEMRGGVQQAVVAQIHARHILLRTNEVEDDQTIATASSPASASASRTAARISPRSQR